MNRILTSIVLGAVWVISLPLLAAPAARADRLRTVYVSAVDAKGEPVTDLVATDLAVKEGGKDRAIASLQPATGTIQLCVLVDDGGSGSFQQGVLTILNRLAGHAEYAISLLSPQPVRLAEYVTDAPTLNAALSKLIQRGRIQQDGEQLIEAVSWTAKDMMKRKATRPVIIALTNGGEPAASEMRDPILADLKASGAALNVIFVNGVGFGKVLSDGPKNSGGILENASSSQGIDTAMGKIASNLLHQYVLTYTLPDGTKPDERLQVSATRKGITLLAPTRIPDK